VSWNDIEVKLASLTERFPNLDEIAKITNHCPPPSEKLTGELGFKTFALRLGDLKRD